MTIASKLVTKVETELSQVPGLGTQLYSDGQILQLLQNTFSLHADEVWWPQLMQWYQPMLDGVTGLPTLPTPFAKYSDIRAVFPSVNAGISRRPLPELPRDINPFQLLGNVAKYIEGTAEVDTSGNPTFKPFRVWPLSSTGVPAVHGRVVSTVDFTIQDTIPFDDLALIYGACWQYLTDDGSNPSSTAKFQALLNKRMAQLKQDYNRKPIELDPRVFRTVDTWTELP